LGGNRDRPTFISLNRFEGKKNVGLAIRAFHCSKMRVKDGKKMRLVIAGELCKVFWDRGGGVGKETVC
jgi:glycosyltransferase involved in cell wall biosynthesis